MATVSTSLYLCLTIKPPNSKYPIFLSHRNQRKSSSVVSPSATAVSAPPERKARRKRQQKEDDPASSASAAEKGLHLSFMEDLMLRARDRDADGVSDVIYDMVAAGLTPGPRSYHGLVVANVPSGNVEGAMQSLRRELSAGLCPLHETFVALVRLFGSKGFAAKGLELLAAMEKLNYDIRQAWLVLVEELVSGGHFARCKRGFLERL